MKFIMSKSTEPNVQVPEAVLSECMQVYVLYVGYPRYIDGQDTQQVVRRHLDST